MKIPLKTFSELKPIFIIYSERSSFTDLDKIITTVLTVIFFYLYGHLGLQLAKGVYFDYMNLAFDFDPPYYVDYLVGNRQGLSYKHPLAFLLRPFSVPFSVLGFAPKEAAALVMALFGSLTIALVYRFSRFAHFGRLEAVTGTLFFAVSTTPMFTSIIVDSYGFASFTIVLVWCLFMRGGEQVKSVFLSERIFAAILVAGVTITNIMHSIVAEFYTWSRVIGFRHALARTALFALIIGLALIIILAICQPVALWNVLYHPMQSAKEIYWLKSNTGEADLKDLLFTYFAYSFFSPDFTKVALSHEVFMLDFREFNYSKIETIVVFLWWSFLFAGLVLGLKDLRFRKVAIPLILVIIFNLVLHLNYQFRASVYLYSAHFHFPIFALSMGAAPWISAQKWGIRIIYLCLLLVLIAAALTINFNRASNFVNQFGSLPFRLFPISWGDHYM